MARRALIGLGTNPNAAAVLVVGAGCDTIRADELAGAIAATKKPVAFVDIESDGGYGPALDRGIAIARDFLAQTADMERKSCAASHLTLGMKCTSSDTTSVLACNPTVGRATDFIVGCGGRAIFTETTEMIGAEHILARRARNPAVARRLCRTVQAMHRRIKNARVDMLRSQPNEGNIKGGISTIEEKSLGGIGKAGTAPIEGIMEWAERPAGNGLYFMDSPANTHLVAIGLAAAGAQLMSLSFGGGVCARLHTATIHTAGGGLPVLPTIKTLSNPTSRKEAAWFDIYAGGIIEGAESAEEAGDRLIAEILAVASGKPTKLENMTGPYQEVWEFYTTGPWV